MISPLKPRDGFDWSHVTWGKPDSVRSAICSYCSAGIGADEDYVPLMLYSDDGHCAQFCDACMKRWWGFS
jgi:hypothetical protein